MSFGSPGGAVSQVVPPAPAGDGLPHSASAFVASASSTPSLPWASPLPAQEGAPHSPALAYPTHRNEWSTAPAAQPTRSRVRHSFDVFSDQLLSLREIVLVREARSGSRVRLGDLVQEALDHFIAQEQARDQTTRTPESGTAPDTHAQSSLLAQAGPLGEQPAEQPAQDGA